MDETRKFLDEQITQLEHQLKNDFAAITDQVNEILVKQKRYIALTQERTAIIGDSNIQKLNVLLAKTQEMSLGKKVPTPEPEEELYKSGVSTETLDWNEDDEDNEVPSPHKAYSPPMKRKGGRF